MDDIFYDKMMYIEMLSDGFYNLRSMNTVYIYPGDGRCIFKRKTLLNRWYLFLLKGRLIIINDAYLYTVGLFLSNVNGTPRRKTSFF